MFCSSLLLLVFKHFDRIVYKPYFLYVYNFLARALFSVQNGKLCYQSKFFFIVTALRIIIHNNIMCFCLETQQMYQKLNIVYF